MIRIREFLRFISSYVRSGKQYNAELDLKASDLAFLIPHAKKYSPRYLGIIILLLLGIALSLPGPAIMGYIIDKVFVAKNIAKLNVLVGILIAILLLSELVRFVEEYYILRLSQEFTNSIRIQLVKRILSFPMSFFKKFQTGYLLSRVEEVNNLGSFFSVTILSLAENSLRFIGAIFLISNYNFKLTLIALLFLPLFFEVTRRSVGTLRASSIGVMEKNAKVRGKIQETLAAIELVKTYAKEEYESDVIRLSFRKMIELEIIQNLFSSLSGKILGIITGVNLLAILWVGGQEIIANRLTVGHYIAFVTYVGYLYGPIQMFALTFLQFQKAFMASKRISSFLDKTAENESKKREHEFKTVRGDIQCENVYYHYGNGKDVLSDISFSISKGERIAFVGRSGAGKTTLVHLLLGLENPSRGRIIIDGVNSERIRLTSLRNRIGIVSQNIFIFDDSILNNIRYSQPEAGMEDTIAAAKISGCHDFISNLPNGYNTNTGEIGIKLSGGEKQRISIARCVLKKPDLIIFDEPTAHLDPPAARVIIDSMKRVFIDKTWIIISHKLESVAWADKIYVMARGRIVQQGTHESLIKRIGEYRTIFVNDRDSPSKQI
jgi:ABC-type bacteriocin/lantibiotic exporter with double-glycine peptidase domain